MGRDRLLSSVLAPACSRAAYRLTHAVYRWAQAVARATINGIEAAVFETAPCFLCITEMARYTLARTRTHAHSHTHARKQAHTRARARTHTCTHARAHTHMHAGLADTHTQ